MDVEDPRENIIRSLPLGNSTLMVVGCCCCCCDVVVAPPPSTTRRSRGGGDEGGVSLKEGEPESMLLLVLEEDIALLLRVLEGFNRFHDPLMLDMDPLILIVLLGFVF